MVRRPRRGPTATQFHWYPNRRSGLPFSARRPFRPALPGVGGDRPVTSSRYLGQRRRMPRQSVPEGQSTLRTEHSASHSSRFLWSEFHASVESVHRQIPQTVQVLPHLWHTIWAMRKLRWVPSRSSRISPASSITFRRWDTARRLIGASSAGPIAAEGCSESILKIARGVGSLGTPNVCPLDFTNGK